MLFNVKMCKHNIIIIGTVFFFLILYGGNQAISKEQFNYFQHLQNDLIQDGFDEDFIKKIYQDPEVIFSPKKVAILFSYKESKLNYKQFIKAGPIKKARQYIQKHKPELDHAENKYGVDQNVITAIILVETRFGTNLGKRPVLNTLSIIASLSNPYIKNVFWTKTKETMKISRTTFYKKAKSRSKWAYSELKAFLNYAFNEKINPVKIPGSFAGAMGIAQFMPSNVSVFGKDGNMDGSINLFNHADAIASIANYLKKHGWHPKIDQKKAHKVILHYNKSKYYADIILKIANILKG